MSDKPHNEAAFPTYRYGCDGMSLRDWFAGQTLAGMLAHPQADYAPFGNPSSGIAGTDMLAREAYRLADAMLAERSKS